MHTPSCYPVPRRCSRLRRKRALDALNRVATPLALLSATKLRSSGHRPLAYLSRLTPPAATFAHPRQATAPPETNQVRSTAPHVFPPRPLSTHPPSPEQWDIIAKDTLLLLMTHCCICCLPPPPAASPSPPVLFQTYAIDSPAVISRLQLPFYSDHVRAVLGDVAACIVDTLILHGKVAITLP